MPANTVKVDRSTQWGNPFRVGDPGIPDAAAAIALFRSAIANRPPPFGLEQFTTEHIRAALGGKNLACWCPEGSPCHADVLLLAANTDAASGSR